MSHEASLDFNHEYFPLLTSGQGAPLRLFPATDVEVNMIYLIQIKSYENAGTQNDLFRHG
jgi:hypothetical protein